MDVGVPVAKLKLGSEIAGLLRGVGGQKGRNALLGPTISSPRFGNVEAPDRPPGAPWDRDAEGFGNEGNAEATKEPLNGRRQLHEDEHIPALRDALAKL